MAKMADDQKPKIGDELAMERLRKQDEEAGVERRPVTDAQKAAIAEIRNFYEAKLAELEGTAPRQAADAARSRRTRDP